MNWCWPWPPAALVLWFSVECRLSAHCSHSIARSVTNAIAWAWSQPGTCVQYNHTFFSYSHTSCPWWGLLQYIGIRSCKATYPLSRVKRVHCMRVELYCLVACIRKMTAIVETGLLYLWSCFIQWVVVVPNLWYTLWYVHVLKAYDWWFVCHSVCL